MIYRVILPTWAKEQDPSLKTVHEGEFTEEQLAEFNKQGYNIYFLPNHPINYDSSKPVDGFNIDVFRYAFVDMDLKEGHYKSKQEFLDYVKQFPNLTPTLVVDSGNGIHMYYEISDLDAMSYLRFQRRLCRLLVTDEAVSKIYQLMRKPGSCNTKNIEDLKLCTVLEENEVTYTCEQLNSLLPIITHEDEQYCKTHFEKTYRINQNNIKVDTKLPDKFGKLLKDSKEAKNIWSGNLDDRSKGDFRLAHIMFAQGFTRDEAMSVLVNSSKAITRAPAHQISYALNIIDQIWTYEINKGLNLSRSVKEILERCGDTLKGTRFPCWSYLDDTLHGFRLGQVIGLVAGSGVGKTAMALNMFEGFVQNNPDYHHFFIPLEQPTNEIADRWKTMCGSNTNLYEKVHLISNYDEETQEFRHLSFDDIKEYILKFQEVTKFKVGCIVIDHIGALKKKNSNGENQDLIDICHQMKAFAIQTNTMLVMQSQSPREKAGIGDLELNKDAAYGTVYFESYCDYLVSIWQPLKRCYIEEGCPTVTAFKFCKIRHKKQGQDNIKEDVCYTMFFDPKTEHLREMTQLEEKALVFYNNKAINKRSQDRKTDVIPYVSARWTNEGQNGETDNSKDFRGTQSA